MRARKVIALFAVIGTLAAAGAAFAGDHKQFKGCMCDGQKFNQPMPHFPPKHGPNNQPADHSKRVKFSPDMPDEIRAKAADAAKLRIDLENVMSKKPLDKAKAIEIYTNISKLESEIRVWRFSHRLDRLEKAAAAREAHRAGKHEHHKPEPEKPQEPKPEEQAK